MSAGLFIRSLKDRRLRSRLLFVHKQVALAPFNLRTSGTGICYKHRRRWLHLPFCIYCPAQMGSCHMMRLNLSGGENVHVSGLVVKLQAFEIVSSSSAVMWWPWGLTRRRRRSGMMEISDRPLCCVNTTQKEVWEGFSHRESAFSHNPVHQFTYQCKFTTECV